MSDAETQLHKALREGQQKLTYFLLGAETAVFAYLGKDFVAEPIGLTRNTFELFALMAVAVSIIAGVLAVSAYLHLQRLNVEQLSLNGKIRNHRLAAESGEPHINFLTGKPETGAVLIERADGYMKEYQELDREIADSAQKTRLIGLAHTCFLIIGLVLLMVSRSIGIFR